jgi:hypothetical protein
MDIEEISRGVKGVQEYRTFFQEHWKNELTKNSYEIITNLSHSFQYLEFLSNCLIHDLHPGIQRQMIKSYIVCGGSIIETLLYCYLDMNKLLKHNEWKELRERKTKSEYLDSFEGLNSEYKKTIDGKQIKITLKMEEKLKSPTKGSPNFNSMISVIISKRIFGDNTEIYESLKKIKNLRNKVHLNNINSEFDHDWRNFKREDGIELKKTLIQIIKSETFNFPLTLSKETFGFLSLSIFHNY